MLFPFVNQIFPEIVHKKRFRRKIKINKTTLLHLEKEILIKNKTYHKLEIPLNFIHTKGINLEKEILIKNKAEIVYLVMDELLNTSNWD